MASTGLSARTIGAVSAAGLMVVTAFATMGGQTDVVAGDQSLDSATVDYDFAATAVPEFTNDRWVVRVDTDTIANAQMGRAYETTIRLTDVSRDGSRIQELISDDDLAAIVELDDDGFVATVRGSEVFGESFIAVQERTFVVDGEPSIGTVATTPELNSRAPVYGDHPAVVESTWVGHDLVALATRKGVLDLADVEAFIGVVSAAADAPVVPQFAQVDPSNEDGDAEADSAVGERTEGDAVASADDAPQDNPNDGEVPAASTSDDGDSETDVEEDDPWFPLLEGHDNRSLYPAPDANAPVRDRFYRRQASLDDQQFIHGDAYSGHWQQRFDIGWEGAFREGYRGQNVLVAVVDAAIDRDHPDLRDAFFTNADEECDNGVDDDENGLVDDCQGWDFVDGDNDVTTTGGARGIHGTAIAGLIGARSDDYGITGMAPDVTLLPVVVASDVDGVAPNTRVGGATDAARGIRYAVDMGADIINVSWALPRGTTAPAVLTEAVAYAEDNDVLIVAAHPGNGDMSRDARFPAALPNDNILSVGATTIFKESVMSSPIAVDIHAPSAAVAPLQRFAYLQAGPEPFYVDHGIVHGASVSAAHVTAAAATVLSAQRAAANVAGAGLLAEGGTPGVKALLLQRAANAFQLRGTSVSGGYLNISRALGIAEPHVQLEFDADAGQFYDNSPFTVDLHWSAAGIPQSIEAPVQTDPLRAQASESQRIRNREGDPGSVPKPRYDETVTAEAAAQAPDVSLQNLDVARRLTLMWRPVEDPEDDRAGGYGILNHPVTVIENGLTLPTATDGDALVPFLDVSEEVLRAQLAEGITTELQLTLPASSGSYVLQAELVDSETGITIGRSYSLTFNVIGEGTPPVEEDPVEEPEEKEETEQVPGVPVEEVLEEVAEEEPVEGQDEDEELIEEIVEEEAEVVEEDTPIVPEAVEVEVAPAPNPEFTEVRDPVDRPDRTPRTPKEEEPEAPAKVCAWGEYEDVQLCIDDIVDATTVDVRDAAKPVVDDVAIVGEPVNDRVIDPVTDEIIAAEPPVDPGTLDNDAREVVADASEEVSDIEKEVRRNLDDDVEAVVDWANGDVFPDFGQRSGGSTVRLKMREVPQDPVVKFGGQVARIISRTDGIITVVSPAHKPDVVDVTVRETFKYDASDPEEAAAAERWRNRRDGVVGKFRYMDEDEDVYECLELSQDCEEIDPIRDAVELVEDVLAPDPGWRRGVIEEVKVNGAPPGLSLGALNVDEPMQSHFMGSMSKYESIAARENLSAERRSEDWVADWGCDDCATAAYEQWRPPVPGRRAAWDRHRTWSRPAF